MVTMLIFNGGHPLQVNHARKKKSQESVTDVVTHAPIFAFFFAAPLTAPVTLFLVYLLGISD